MISKIKTRKRRPPNNATVAFNFAEYIWKDQYTTTINDPIPNITFEFCFKYGEKEWDNGSKWDDIRDAARKLATNNVNLRIPSCP